MHNPCSILAYCLCNKKAMSLWAPPTTSFYVCVTLLTNHQQIWVLAVLCLEFSVLILTGRSTQKSRRQQGNCLTNNIQILRENPPPSPISFPPDFVLRAQPRPSTPASQYLSQNKTIQCLILVTTLVATRSSGSARAN